MVLMAMTKTCNVGTSSSDERSKGKISALEIVVGVC